MIRKIFSKVFPNSRLFSSKQAIRVIPWLKDKGDKTHRLNYDLNDNSIVFDMGGYEGQWASDIFSKYCCLIHVFEPYMEYFEKIKIRFEKNGKINVHPFGLSAKTLDSSLSISGDSSSAFKSGQHIAPIKLIQAMEFMKENNVEEIDLLKINIEGGEYDLLDHLIETQLISKIKNLQIQFHDFVPDAEKRMKTIQDSLKKTHVLTYQYEFVWESWRIK